MPSPWRGVPRPSNCHFVIPSFPTAPGQHLTLVGSVPELGSWNPAEGLKMTWQPGHAWVGETSLASGAMKPTEAKVGGR